MRQLLKTLFTINVFLTGIVLILCLILLLAKAANAETIEQYASKIKINGVIKVMVIDTGVDADNPLLYHYMPEARQTSKLYGHHKEDYVDSHGHGSHIAGIILYGGFHLGDKPGRWYVKKEDIMCDNVQIYSCKYYYNDSDDLGNIRRTEQCLQRAYIERMHVINYSGGGTAPFAPEYEIIKRLGKNHHTIMIAALGNENSNLKIDTYYPASYSFQNTTTKGVEPLDNVIGVGALNRDGSRHSLSNYRLDSTTEMGEDVYATPMELGQDVISTLPRGKKGPMTGTSQATAMFLHKLLIEKCKEFNN